MSLTTDLKSYADTALAQGKQVAGTVTTKAGASLNDVTTGANTVVVTVIDGVRTARQNVSQVTGRASDTFADLRAQASTTLNLDAVRSAVEPYVAQAKGYTTAVTDRAESVLSGVSSDPRVAKVLTTATALATPVVETVQERVVAPVLSLTRRGTTAPQAPATPATTVAPAAPKSTAAKTTARKAPAKKATATS